MKLKRIREDAILPSYSHPGDVGMDLYSADEVVLHQGDFAAIGTGIAIELPEGCEAQIRPRSGLAAKHGITVLNSPGTIDEGYRGEIGVILINHGPAEFAIKRGMKIAQMVIANVRRESIDESLELSGSQRGADGFGSTGTK